MATKHPEAKQITRKVSTRSTAAEMMALNEDDPRIQHLAKKALRKMFEDARAAGDAAETTSAEFHKRVEAQQERRTHPLKHLTDDDIHAVTGNLNQAAMTLLSIHRLSIDGCDDSSGLYLVAITNLARSLFKTVDACIERLEGDAPRMGNFATEFDFD